MPLPLMLLGLAARAVPFIADLLTDDRNVGTVAKVVGEVASAVTGQADPGQAAAAIEADPELMSQFTAQIEERRNELYALTTERLKAEQGEVSAETLGALSPKDAGRVAWLRMTTRPWAVRWCVRALVWPPLAIVTVDALLSIANVFSAALGWISSLPIIKDGAVSGYQVVALKFGLVGPVLLDAGAGFTTLYSWFAPTATSIVLGYMGLREVGKAREQGTTVSDAAGAVGGVLKGLFGKK